MLEAILVGQHSLGRSGETQPCEISRGQPQARLPSQIGGFLPFQAARQRTQPAHSLSERLERGATQQAARGTGLKSRSYMYISQDARGRAEPPPTSG